MKTKVLSTKEHMKRNATDFVGKTWTIERIDGKVYVTHIAGHTVALNDPSYPSAPEFHVPKYVLTRARKLLP